MGRDREKREEPHQLTVLPANGRDSASNPSVYVFNNATVSAAPGQTVPAGAYFLGRPWREYARVIFQRSSLSAVVNAAGWRTWNSGDERTCCVEFGEFENRGAGASGSGGRAKFSRQLGEAAKIEAVLGADYASRGFYDASYM